MPCADNLHGQLQLVCQYFHSRLGLPLLGYEIAELITNDKTWEPFNDLPIRLHIGPGAPVCVAWSKAEELWIACDEPVPFWDRWSEYGYCWIASGLPELEPLRGGTLRSAHLGRDADDELEGLAFNQSYRLLLEFDRGWLEVSDFLDANAYAVHAAKPDGNWVRCA